ncbi:MAG TPA: sialidase family protein, partial [Kofleriaceae bacterium]|nr:sialidase family protein [Kofleriaceae bacterium]
LVWDPATEVDITTADGTDDWVPSLTADATGALVVAFARNRCPPPDTCYGIWTTSSTDGVAWTRAAPVIEAGGGLEHHLPAIAQLGGTLTLAWDPYDAAAGVPWEGLGTGAHISLVTSAPGGWTAPRDVTPREPAAVSAFPTLYADHAGAGHVAWLAASATGQAVVERPLAALDQSPAPLPIDGYSPRIVATPTLGIYLAAWVAGPGPDHQIAVRVFARP